MSRRKYYISNSLEEVLTIISYSEPSRCRRATRTERPSLPEGQGVLQMCAGEGRNEFNRFQFIFDPLRAKYVFFNEATEKYICRSSTDPFGHKFLVAQTDFDMDECSLEIHDLDIWGPFWKHLEKYELYARPSVPCNSNNI